MFWSHVQSKKKMSNYTFIKIRTGDLVRLRDPTERKLRLGNLAARGLGRKTIYYNEYCLSRLESRILRNTLRSKETQIGD